MRKLLTLFTALLFVGSMWGTAYISYNGTTQDASTTISSSNVGSGSAGKISWTGTSCTYSSSRVNIAANGSITFTAASGFAITKIVITSGSSASYYGTWTSSPSVTPSTSSGVTTFDGLSANSVTVTTSTAFRCTSGSDIKIYYTEDQSTVDAPTLSKTSGTYLGAQNVTISNYDEDLIYFYTTDGTTPAADANLDPTGTSQGYDNSVGISISSSCSLQVIAYNGNLESSSITSATYTIKNIEHAGTAEDPYSIADAYLAIDHGTSEQKTNKYAAGIVSKIISKSVSDGQISYNISVDGETTSDQLQAYKGKNNGGSSFTNLTDVKVGDEVVVYGTLTKYSTTYEFGENNQLESQARTPNFTISNVANLAEGNTLAIGDLTINKGGSAGDVTLSSSSDETVVKIIGNSIYAEGAGDATITAILAANGIYKEKSTTFTVHVYEPCTNFLTLSQGTPTHGSFEMNKEEGEYPTCEAAIAVIITPEADERYHVQSVSATTGETGVDNGNGTWTITFAQNFNNASEINVTFEEDAKSTVTWNVNGDESLKTTVYNGDKPVFPATPSAIDATSTTFYGWATAAWDGKVANLDAKTVYTKASNMPSVSGDVTYYAVFVKVEGGEAFDGEHGGTYKIYAVVNDTKYYAKNVDNNKINSSEDVAEAADFEIEVVQGGFAIKLGEDYIKYNGSTDITTDAESYTWTMETGTKGTWRVNSATTGRALLYRAGSTKKFGGYSTGNVTAAGEYYDLEIATATSYSDFVTTTYAINCAAATNGSVSADKASAAAGETVTLTLTPDAGYKVASVAVNGGDPLAVTENQATFVMPAAIANVAATFSVATVIDNTEVEGKAVKVLRNGVLYIEKNGVRYNAMGQVIK